MNMHLEDYENITLSQFFQKLQGYYEHQQQLEEHEWKRTQYIAYSILMNNPYIKKIDKPASFDDFLNRGKEKKINNERKLTKEEFLRAING